MPTIRVPYPADPAKRRDLFARAAAVLSRFGTYEGTPEQGNFRGTTPIGSFSGYYFAPEGGEELHIELVKKPLLVPTSLVESEVRRLMTTV